MLLWFTDLMSVTEEVTIHRPNVSTLLSSTFVRGDLNTATRGPFIWSLINIDYNVKIPANLRISWDKSLIACEELISFDVVSLFTKIPVDLAVKVAEERLREDASLGQRTSLPVEDIIHLLSFCLKTTQFTYNGTYYQQVFGTAMGSPVSAVIANMVMEDVEQRALATSPVKPLFGNDMLIMLSLRYPETNGASPDAFEFSKAVDPIHP